MKADPIVEEIRKGRLAHAERFNFDISEIAADYRKLEEKHKDRILSGKPKPLPELEKNRKLTSGSARPPVAALSLRYRRSNGQRPALTLGQR